MPTEPVSDVLTRVEQVVKQLPALLVDVLNEHNHTNQADQLRDLGRLLGELSATVLARAAEVDGHNPERIIIDARRPE